MISHIKRKRTLKNNFSGFSLLEVLIALALSGLLIGVVVKSLSPNSNDRETKIKSIKQMIRFARNESIIQNRVTRIAVELGNPSKMHIEIANDFLAPLRESESEEDEVRTEDKSPKKRKNNGFSKVTETSQKDLTFENEYQIYAVATNTDTLALSDIAYIYFYPTGEKDSALILLYSSEEMAQIEISPFLGTIEDKGTLREKGIIQDEVLELESMAKKIYEEWINPTNQQK